MDWQKLFTTKILDRGYDYYVDDAVSELEVDEDTITAVVYGTEDYDVEITLKNGEVQDMFCTCPYANDGHNCKHMAAVLYQYENEYEDVDSFDQSISHSLDQMVLLTEKYNKEHESNEKINKNKLFKYTFTQKERDEKSIEIDKLINKANVDDIKSFLKTILLDDEKILLRFYNTIQKDITEDDIKNYKKRISNIVDKYSGRGNFIEYYKAADFSQEIDEVIYNDISMMITNNNYVAAVEILLYIYEEVGSINTDDDWHIQSSGDLAIEKIKDILDKANVEDKTKMFSLIISSLNKGIIVDYMVDDLEDLLFECFDENDFYKLKLKYVKDEIKKAELMNDGWSKDHKLGDLVLKYIRLLSLDNSNKEEINDLYKKYWCNSDVRKYYIDDCINNKQYKEALNALDESIELDKEYRGLVNDYSKKKKEIYKITNDKNSYLLELWKSITIYDKGNLESFRELKEQYDFGEWFVKREQLFTILLGDNVNINHLYNEEKLYDRLLNSIINKYDFEELKKYTDSLKEDYPNELLDMYTKEINKKVEYAGGRSYYTKLVTILRKMKEIKGGDKVVTEIVNNWKKLYSNRSAMLDELRKL